MIFGYDDPHALPPPLAMTCKPRLLRWPWLCLLSGGLIYIAGCFVLGSGSDDLRMILVGHALFFVGLGTITTRD